MTTCEGPIFDADNHFYEARVASERIRSSFGAGPKKPPLHDQVSQTA